LTFFQKKIPKIAIEKNENFWHYFGKKMKIFGNFLKKRKYLAIKKKANFWHFFFEKMSSFWQFFLLSNGNLVDSV